jgi:hypothetical protein
VAISAKVTAKIIPNVSILYCSTNEGKMYTKLYHISGGMIRHPIKKPITAPNPEADKTYSK